jgi:peptide/nickel transport system permease protein
LKIFIVKRLLALFPIILIVASIQFFIIHLAPGDPARMIVGESAPQEEVDRIRTQLGLDRPIVTQYVLWLVRTLSGDLGDSLYLGRPVVTAIKERLAPSILLSGLALVIAVMIGVPSGVLAATFRNSIWDQGIMLFSIAGLAMPNFWLALNLIIVFSVFLGWLPVAGYVPLPAGLWPCLKYLILPAFVLGFRAAALIARMSRTNMLEVLGQDYIRTARSKGLSEWVVVGKHALRPSFIPTLTVIGFTLGTLMSAAVIIETVFLIPGIGQLLVLAVLRRDYPLIQGTIMFVAGLNVLINFVVDLIYVYIDPRIKY